LPARRRRDSFYMDLCASQEEDQQTNCLFAKIYQAALSGTGFPVTCQACLQSSPSWIQG
jgi:hypothetical protein